MLTQILQDVYRSVKIDVYIVDNSLSLFFFRLEGGYALYMSECRLY